MYSEEQRIKALHVFHQTGSVTDVVRRLGYPSRKQLSVPNEVQRDFHSEKLDELLLSDISEFAIPSGKVYLSPAVDCFDGMLVTWRISGHPNADLVNHMQKLWLIVVVKLVHLTRITIKTYCIVCGKLLI